MRVRAQAVDLTAADLRERYRCSRMWITRRIKQSNFPGPVTAAKPTPIISEAEEALGIRVVPHDDWVKRREA